MGEKSECAFDRNRECKKLCVAYEEADGDKSFCRRGKFYFKLLEK